MTKEKRRFLKLLKRTFKLAPDLRIAQALFNLGFNESSNIAQGYEHTFFKDNYNQDDKTTVSKVKKGYEKLFKEAFKGHHIEKVKVEDNA